MALSLRDRVAPGRIARLRALAAWHREWKGRHLPEATYRPDPDRPEGSDYSQHHLDVDTAAAPAEDEFHVTARRILGLDQ